MMKYWLIIKLHSDMCAATGNAVPGVVDSEAADEYGFPVIYGKRLKGGLLEAAEELRASGLITQNEIRTLFGLAGQAAGGSLKVHNAHIWKVPVKDESAVTVDDYGALLQEIQQMRDISPAEIRDYFTCFRTQTAIEGNTAKKHNLRTMRTVNRGLVFRALLEIEESSSRLEDVLSMCVKALKGIGTGVSRGMGEVSCICMPYYASGDSRYFALKGTGESEEELILEYELYLKAPLILTNQRDRALSEIGGRALLGAFAGMFVKDYHLGNEAHKNQDFRRIFLEGGVRFGFAFPKMQGDYREYVFHSCPKFLRKVKRENYYVNLMQANAAADKKLDKENNLICFDTDSAKILTYQVKKEMRMHHARPSDHGVGHASEEDGQLYSYQSVAAGQIFKGVIKGKCEDLQKLIECLGRREGKIRLGKSRTAEYGDADLQITNIRRQQNEKKTCEQISEAVLWFVTPLILQDAETGDIKPDLDILKKAIENKTGCKLADKDGFEAFVSYMEIGGYNGKWHLPQPQIPALAAGSVIHIKSTQPFSTGDMEGISWGIRQNEGYGQAKVLIPEKLNREFTRIELNDFQGRIRQTDKAESPLVKLLLQRQAKGRNRAEQFHAAELSGGKAGSNLNMTTINQLYRLFRNCRKDENWLELLTQSAEKIKDEKKKKAVIEYLNKLKGKTSDYADIYFKNTIWDKRMEGRA